ncbi:hypothetical protein ACFLYM_00970 [Chloroflexota bacterium]
MREIFLEVFEKYSQAKQEYSEYLKAMSLISKHGYEYIISGNI